MKALAFQPLWYNHEAFAGIPRAPRYWYIPGCRTERLRVTNVIRSGRSREFGSDVEPVLSGATHLFATKMV